MYGGFEVYKTYLAVKLHFTSTTYDYNKYDGKINAKLAQHSISEKNCCFYCRLQETTARNTTRHHRPLRITRIRAELATESAGYHEIKPGPNQPTAHCSVSHDEKST